MFDSMTGYTIRQIAEEFGLTLRALRFYEQRGLFKPHRSGTKSGSQVRLYGDDTRARIAEVVALRRFGFTVAEILKGKITHKQYEAQLEAVCAQRDELEQVIQLLNARLMEFESQRRA